MSIRDHDKVPAASRTHKFLFRSQVPQYCSWARLSRRMPVKRTIYLSIGESGAGRHDESVPFRRPEAQRMASRRSLLKKVLTRLRDAKASSSKSEARFPLSQHESS